MKLSNKLFIIGALSLLIGSCSNGSNGSTEPEELSEQIIELKAKAEQGDAEAQNELGKCYYNGEGVEQNYEEAVKWYTKSAEQGLAKAQCNLGKCYAHGQGVEQNYAEAVKWYTKSADQGDAGGNVEWEQVITLV